MDVEILVVDDDQDIRTFVSELLQDEGYRVATAINGREALNVLTASAQPPRLVILDMMMPIMDGQELLRVLRQHPTFETLPVIVMSASTKLEQQVAGFSAVTTLGKPVELAALLQLVQAYV